MMHRRSRISWSFGLLLLVSARGAFGGGYQQTNLVTSATDPDLINPWGISFGPTTPFWISDNGTGKSTLYNGFGQKQGLIVTMPAGSEPITGQVFNGGSNFNADRFIFASENGTIAGWRGALGTTAEQLFSVTDAVYKGLAINPAQDTLFAANFHSGAIDVFNSSGLTTSIIDPGAPTGYAPFNIQFLGGKFYVAFALQDADKHDDSPGVGHGLISVFDPSTNTFTHLITGSAAGGTVSAINSPWGMALAPSGFGPFGGDLLVGNFGDGSISAFDPTSGAFLGRLTDESGNVIVNPGLWSLEFGNGGVGFDPNSLYITAGGADEASGVFARITFVPEPSSAALGLIAFGLIALHRRWRIAPA